VKCKECFFSGDGVKEEVCESCSRNIVGKEYLRILIIALLSFAVARFFFYLLTAGVLRPSDALGAPVDFHFDPLASFFFPVSLLEYPSYILVTGLIMFVLIFAPVSLAMAYGPLWGVLAGTIAALLSPVRLLAFPMALGCFLSGSRYVKLNNKAVSLCLGFLPPVGFLFYQVASSSREGVDSLIKGAVLAPYFFLLFLLIAFSFVTVAVMRRSHWNPQVVLFETGAGSAVLFILFFVSIGVVEVEYPVLARTVSLEGELFREAIKASGFKAAVSGEAGQPEQLARIAEIKMRIERDRSRAIEAFDSFIRTFPASGRTPAAIYEKCMLLDMKIDVNHLKQAGEVILYTEVVSSASERVYRGIIKQFPLSKEAASSHLRLASYYCRTGKFGEAASVLEDVVNTYASRVPKDYHPPVRRRPRSMMELIRTGSAQRAAETLAAYDDAVRWAKKTLGFIKDNGDYDGEPLRKFCELDPRASDFRGKVNELMLLYPATTLKDNLLLAILPDEPGGRVLQLEKLHREYPDGDTADEVLFMLGKIIYGVADDRGDLRKAEKYLTALTEDYPQSPFFWKAKEILLEIQKP